MRSHNNWPRRMGFLMVSFFLLTSTAGVSAEDSPWPQFRGPNFNPTSQNANLPEHWTTSDNVEWSAEIDGRGWSSPIVTNGMVFVTTVTTDGDSKLPQTGTDFSNDYVAELVKQGLSEEEITKKVTERDIELPKEVTLHYYLICFDLETGKRNWTKEFYTGRPPGGRHRKNSFTSETPVTDGTNVYIYAANLGLYAFDISGNQLWTKELKSHPIYLDFGTGASAALCEDRLIISNDNEEQQFTAAYDKNTGDLIWQTNREPLEGVPAAAPKSGWVTPFIWKNETRTEIITMSPGVAISYDLDGKELWRLKGMSMAPAASSFAFEGKLILNGGRGRPIYAVLPGASGDISTPRGEEPNDHVAWVAQRAGTYIPTAVGYRGALYVLNDKGIMSRLDAKTGKQTYKKRLKSKGADFTTSPWAYNGNIYCLSEQGDTFVIAATEEYKLMHVNAVGDMCLSSPAIVGERLLLRTEKRLYSIRQAKN